MKQKTILLKGDRKREFVKLLCSRFGIYSKSETDIIYCMVKFGLFAPFYLDKYLRERVILELGIRNNTISVMVNRMIKAGVMLKAGKTYSLNPCFSNLDDVEQICFRFEKKTL